MKLLNIILLLILITLQVITFTFTTKTNKEKGFNIEKESCTKKLRLANKLASEKLYEAAAEEYTLYAENCAKDNREKAYALMRLGELFSNASNKEQALKNYYKAQQYHEGLEKSINEKIKELGVASTEEKTEVIKPVYQPELNLGKPIARIKNREIYEKEFSDYMAQMPLEMQKMATTNPNVLALILRQFVIEEAAYDKAIREKMHIDPRVNKILIDSQKQILMKFMMSKEIAEQEKITEEDIRKFYEETKSKYTQAENIEISIYEYKNNEQYNPNIENKLKESENIFLDKTFDYIPEIGEAKETLAKLFMLDKGEILKNEKIGNKKFAIMIKNRGNSEAIPYELLKNQLSAVLAKEKQQAMTETFVKKIEEEEDVEIYAQ